eukprot:gene7377-biopygen10569
MHHVHISGSNSARNTWLWCLPALATGAARCCARPASARRWTRRPEEETAADAGRTRAARYRVFGRKVPHLSTSRIYF